MDIKILKRKTFLMIAALSHDCFDPSSCSAQSITVHSIHSATKSTEYIHLRDIFPIIGILIPIVIFLANQVNKVAEEKRGLILKRLNSQLSDLYGPLYTWCEIGNANYESYRRTGNKISFNNPDYILWLKSVFMRTNKKIEQAIIEHSDLFLGNIPTVCIAFCQHLAALQTCLTELQDHQHDQKTSQSLDDRMKRNPHPGEGFHAYVQSAFEELKKQQSSLLIYQRPRWYQIKKLLANPGIIASYSEADVHKRVKALTMELAPILTYHAHRLRNEFILPERFFDKSSRYFDFRYLFHDKITCQVTETRLSDDQHRESTYKHFHFYTSDQSLIKLTKDADEKLVAIEEACFESTMSTITYYIPSALRFAKRKAKMEKKFVSEHISGSFVAIGKAELIYEESGKLVELRYYDEGLDVDYTIIADNSDPEVPSIIRKRDAYGQTIELLRRTQKTPHYEFYTWYHPISNVVDWTRSYERNQMADIIKIVDRDPITKQVISTMIEYDYAENGRYASQIRRVNQLVESKLSFMHMNECGA